MKLKRVMQRVAGAIAGQVGAALAMGRAERRVNVGVFVAADFASTRHRPRQWPQARW